MEFRDYLRVLRKRAWMPIVCLFVFLCAAWYYNFYMLKSIYVSDVKIYIGKEQGQNDQQSLMNELLTGQRLAKDYKEIVKSRRVTELAAKKINRSDITPDKITEMINVELKAETLILIINAESTDPFLARDVGNVVADVFKSKAGELIQSENVSIIDKAITPVKPSKPNRVLNILIATMVGLVIGVATTFALDYLDTTIETPKDIEQYLGLQVLGVIPSFKDSLRKRYYGYY